MTYNVYKCKMPITVCDVNSITVHLNEGDTIMYTRFNLNGTLYVRIIFKGGIFNFLDFNIEDCVEPLEGAEKELADTFVNAQEEIDKAAESFNPVPATKEQKERLEKFLGKLCEGFVKAELTPIQKMSDNELCRKLDIARRNVEKWQKRIDDIQRERSSRYRHWKSMQDVEW